MRKLVSLFAATTLLVSSIAFAEEGQTTTNSNDVLQTIPHDNNTPEGVNIADASNTTTTTTETAKNTEGDKSTETKMVKKRHCKHHCKKHHHKKRVKMSGPSQPNDATPPKDLLH